MSVHYSGGPRTSTHLCSTMPDHKVVIHYGLVPHLYSQVPLTLP